MAKNSPATQTESTKKNFQVNGTISAELYEALEDYRWTVRIDRMPKLVARALEEYAENHGLKVGESSEAPSE